MAVNDNEQENERLVKPLIEDDCQAIGILDSTVSSHWVSIQPQLFTIEVAYPAYDPGKTKTLIG